MGRWDAGRFMLAAAMSVSKLWNDDVKAMEWRCQRWSLTEAMNYELGSMNYEL